MNGRRRVAIPTMSCGANSRIGFWRELSGSAAIRERVVRERLGRSAGDGDADVCVGSNAIV